MPKEINKRDVIIIVSDKEHIINSSDPINYIKNTKPTKKFLITFSSCIIIGSNGNTQDRLPGIIPKSFTEVLKEVNCERR